MTDPQYNETTDAHLSNIVAAAVRQAMTPFRLTQERHEEKIERMWLVVFGDALTRQPGMVDQLKEVTSKVDDVYHVVAKHTDQFDDLGKTLTETSKTVTEVKDAQEKADEQRKVMLGYFKGGRWAVVILLALGLFDNNAIVSVINKIIHLFP